MLLLRLSTAALIVFLLWGAALAQPVTAVAPSLPDQQVALVPGRHFSMVGQPAEVGKALAGFSTKLNKQAVR